MESGIPKYDLPVDYVIGEGRAKDLLEGYLNFPCMIESGFFILCVKGSMQVTINATTYDIGENDLMTLPLTILWRFTNSHPIFRFIIQAFHLIL